MLAGAERRESVPYGVVVAWAVATLVAINVVLFLVTHDLADVGEALATVSLGSGTLRTSVLIDYSTFAPAIAPDGIWSFGLSLREGGQWWRIFTGGFLHDSFLHIGFNALLGYLIGRRLELLVAERFGAGWAASTLSLVWVASIAGGSAGAMLLDAESPVIGASGAVFGLMGAAFVTEAMTGLGPFRSGLGTLIIINVLFSFIVTDVSLGGHLGGLAVGALCGLVVGNLHVQARPLRVTGLLVLIGLAATAGAFGASTTWDSPLF